MKKLTTLIITLFSMASLSYAQNEDCPCCNDFHKQFDFWVGEWNVYDTTGILVGENSITKLEDGCILNEHWRSVNGGSGRSYNYFNSTDSTWNQVWIDNQGGNLVLKGKREGDKMILKSELLKGQKVKFYYNKISWTLNTDGSVTQLWEILDQNHKVLSVAFEGIYRRM